MPINSVIPICWKHIQTSNSWEEIEKKLYSSNLSSHFTNIDDFTTLFYHTLHNHNFGNTLYLTPLGIYKFPLAYTYITLLTLIHEYLNA